MGSLGEEIFKALTGHTEQRSASFSDMVRDLVDYRAIHGMSRRAMSRMSGIPETTLRRWDNGARPTARDMERQQGKLTPLWREMASSPAALARWRADNFSLGVDNVPHHGGTQSRTLTSNTLRIRPGTGDKIVAAYLRGDDGAAARALVAGIGEPWYRQVMFGDWMSDDDDLAYEGYDVDSDYSLAVSAT